MDNTTSKVNLIIGSFFFIALFGLIILKSEQLVIPMPHPNPDCRAGSGDLIIDSFTSDTVFVERSFSHGGIRGRTPNHQTITIPCGNYKVIED